MNRPHLSPLAVLAALTMVLLSACQWFGHKGPATPDYSFRDSLYYWTDSATLASNPELVETANTLFQLYCKTDDRTLAYHRQWHALCRDSMIAYYRRHYEPRDTSVDVQCEQVLAAIDSLYTGMSQGPVMSRWVAAQVTLDAEAWREWNEFLPIYDACSSEELRAALLDESNAWRIMGDSLSVVNDDMIALQFWGGSICAPLGVEFRSELVLLRVEDLRDLRDLLTTDVAPVPEGSPSGHTPVPAASPSGLLTTPAIDTLQQFADTLPTYLDVVFCEDDSCYYDSLTFIDVRTRHANTLGKVQRVIGHYQEWLLQRQRVASLLPPTLRPSYEAYTRLLVSDLMNLEQIISTAGVN